MHTPAFTHAGGLVLRGTGHERRVLVVRPSRPTGDEWVLPKGHIEPGEIAPEAAVREVREEAGAIAADPEYLGYAAYRAKGEDVVCAFYRMRLVEDRPSEEGRGKAWLSLDDARELIPFREVVGLVERAFAGSVEDTEP